MRVDGKDYVLACWNGVGFVINPELSHADRLRVADYLCLRPCRDFSWQNEEACRAAVRLFFGAGHEDDVQWPDGFVVPKSFTPPCLASKRKAVSASSAAKNPPAPVEMAEAVGDRSVHNDVDDEASVDKRVVELRHRINGYLYAVSEGLHFYAELTREEELLTHLPYGECVVQIMGEDVICEPGTLANAVRAMSRESRRQLGSIVHLLPPAKQNRQSAVGRQDNNGDEESDTGNNGDM